MAKGGVTYSEVFNAYQALMAAGEKPTDRALLEYIGTGSMTTIIKHRRMIVARMQGVFGNGGLVNSSLRDALATVEKELEQIYEGKVAQAKAEGGKALSIVQEKLDQVTQTLDKVVGERNKADEDLQVVRSLLDSESIKSAALAESKHQLDIEVASLKSTITEMKSAVEKAEAMARAAKAQQDHFESRTREQMKEAKAIQEDVIKQAQRERNEYQAALTQSSEKLTEANRYMGSLEADVAAGRKVISDNLRTIDQLNDRIKTLESEINEAYKINGSAEAKLTQAQTELAACKEIRTELQSRCESLEQEIKKSREDSDALKRALSDANKALAAKLPGPADRDKRPARQNPGD
ncbi:DNA-binding protein (plasmid) [Halopseudomonas sp. SMJS2]|uniref:DNA-binding protein n=1 Tax=Halopseudomonas sp. SMJS2 TaxID=3041098 RepID=UPI0024531CD8|nr:DNA-binding protein [Halopseudomonas sp. SMJS2]WGK63555.1 DNA-binding protein [Halopseudomonas sp. SMJS2]